MEASLAKNVKSLMVTCPSCNALVSISGKEVELGSCMHGCGVVHLAFTCSRCHVETVFTTDSDGEEC